MDSVYHVLDKFPALEKEDMPIELETLATQLVESGLLRIDALDKGNFSRIKEPMLDINCTFSKRELNDPILLKNTKRKLLKLYSPFRRGAQLEEQVKKTINYLKKNIDKFVQIDLDLEMKIARIIAQSTHPVVLSLMILERVEVYFSYSYNIGDVLDVVTWQEAGQNSGMQSTDGHSAAVFVSSAGDPTRIPKGPEIDEEMQNRIDAKELEEVYGDGRPAQARAVIIGAQEMGHYSDMIRDQYGRYAGRHSAIMGGYMASPKAKAGRLSDLRMVFDTKDDLYKMGLLYVKELERRVKFYRKNKVRNYTKRFFNYLWYRLVRFFIFRRINSKVFPPVKKYLKERYPATTIDIMLYDMIFNLEPKADVYANQDKNIEEAIACIEALARVPQQERKWGKKTVEFLTPSLYKLYNFEVLPRCVEDYERSTNSKFIIDIDNYHYLPWYKRAPSKIKKFIKNLFKRKIKK
jgi:hypothetical protein